MKRLPTTAALLVAGTLFVAPAANAGDEDAKLIESAESAAPAAVSSEATIYAINDKGEMRTVRKGKTGWWCIPDNPGSPGKDPICGDANALEWAKAWIGKKDHPPKGKVGFMYMLVGGSDASNTDPFAAKPEKGDDWVATGPHVMILNANELMQGYPTDADPDTSKPYVMWHGTPYAHLMIPVE